MNGLITVGVPLSNNPQILTSGLSLGDAPPPPEQVASSGMLQLGITGILVSNRTGTYESPYYNLPVNGTRLSIQSIGTITSVTINLSNDGIVFNPLPTISTATITTVNTNARWIQAVTVGTGITVKINVRREKH